MKKMRSFNELLDTDNDGVMDVADCNPYNPNQQGIGHRVASKLYGMTGNKEKEEEYRQKDLSAQREKIKVLKQKQQAFLIKQQKENERRRLIEEQKRLKQEVRKVKGPSMIEKVSVGVYKGAQSGTEKAVKLYKESQKNKPKSKKKSGGMLDSMGSMFGMSGDVGGRNDALFQGNPMDMNNQLFGNNSTKKKGKKRKNDIFGNMNNMNNPFI